MSVPPEKILKPFSVNLCDKTFAFLITFFVYVLNSSDKASLKQTALAAITCIKGPPCKPGKIALLNFLANSSLFVKIIPPLGPLNTLCVVEVTTYAVAQGNLLVGGLGVAGNDGSSLIVNVPTVGRIPGGATVERLIETDFLKTDSLILNLHQGDFSITNQVAEAVNDVFGGGVAIPLDSRSVKVRAPVDPSQKVAFISMLENIEIEPLPMPEIKTPDVGYFPQL